MVSGVIHILSHRRVIVPNELQKKKTLAQPARHQKTQYEELNYKV